jgi:hypothetical protein
MAPSAALFITVFTSEGLAPAGHDHDVPLPEHGALIAADARLDQHMDSASIEFRATRQAIRRIVIFGPIPSLT